MGKAEAFYRSSFEGLVAAGRLLSTSMAQPVYLEEGLQFVRPYIIGDGAFPLSQHLMKPYGLEPLDEKELAFNRVSVRALRHIDQALGRLVAQWQVLQAARPGFKAEFIREVTILCCALHNICQRERELASTWLSEEAPVETQERYRVDQAFEARQGAKRARRDEEPAVASERVMRDILAQRCLERRRGGFI